MFKNSCEKYGYCSSVLVINIYILWRRGDFKDVFKRKLYLSLQAGDTCVFESFLQKGWCNLPLQGEKSGATKRTRALRGASPDGSAQQIQKTSTERAAPPVEVESLGRMPVYNKIRNWKTEKICSNLKWVLFM